MLNRFLANYLLNVIVPVILVLSLFSISYAQGTEARPNEPLSMLAFSLGLISIGFFIRRHLRR